jgi:hypothetical protein
LAVIEQLAQNLYSFPETSIDCSSWADNVKGSW